MAENKSDKPGSSNQGGVQKRAEGQKPAGRRVQPATQKPGDKPAAPKK